MPGFLSRWVEWFRAKPTETSALIIIIALVVAVIAGPLLKGMTAAALAFVLVVVVVQIASRARVRRWAIALVALLVASVLFSAPGLRRLRPVQGWCSRGGAESRGAQIGDFLPVLPLLLALTRTI